MTTPFDDLIRTTLSDIAEEALAVNLTTRAFEQVRRRRMTTITVGAATAVAAVLIGAPLAFAGGDGTQPTLQPADPLPATTIAPPAPSPANPSTGPAPQVSPDTATAPPAPQVTPADTTAPPAPSVSPANPPHAPDTTIAPPSPQSPPRAVASTSPAHS